MASLYVAALLVASCFFAPPLTTAHGCQRTITVTNANVSLSSETYGLPEGYLPYTWCRYHIDGPTNELVKVTFKAFDLELSAGCTADAFKIWDLSRPGVEEFLKGNKPCRPSSTPATYIAPNFGPACGNSTPNNFISRGNRIVIEFCADYSVQKTGWNLGLEYLDPALLEPRPPCGRTIQLFNLEKSEWIQSPNWPQQYSDLDRCTWTVLLQPHHSLRMESQAFNLVDCNDTLTVTDVTNNKTLQFCGSNRLTGLTLEDTAEVRIEFSAHSWDTTTGFRIEMGPLACKSGFQQCDDQSGCVDMDRQCDGVKDCKDGSDENASYCAPDCGVSHFPIVTQELPRIVGGLEVSRNSVPWQAATLEVRRNRQFCGATIISDRWLLTAAHCFNSAKNASDYKARIGGHDLLLTPREDLANEIVFQGIFLHPLYKFKSAQDYDFCLIKLSERIKFRKNIVPACLPRQGEFVKEGDRCIVSGWGTKGQYGRSQEEENRADATSRLVGGDEMHNIVVPVVNQSVCESVYGASLTDRMICAGLIGTGGIDSCQGDSGGPFVCKNRYQKYMVSGVVSWGRGCALPTHPGVYANTAYVMDWIHDTIARN